MAEDMGEEFELAYKDAYGCRCVPCTGVVLSGPVEAGLYQLTLYSDAQRILPEHLMREAIAENYATYTRKGNVQAEPYREVQVRAVISAKTLESLSALIQRTLLQTKQLAEKADDSGE